MITGNLNSWRKQTARIRKGVNEVDFIDSSPNTFYIVNNTEANLYIGMGIVPSEIRYEKKIKRYTSDIFGQPNGIIKLYVFSDIDVELYIDIYSQRQDSNVFDFSILKETTIDMDGTNESLITLNKYVTQNLPETLQRIYNVNDKSSGKLIDTYAYLQVLLPDILGKITSLETLESSIIGKVTDIKATVNALRSDSLKCLMGTISMTTSTQTVSFDSECREIQFLTNDTNVPVVVELEGNSIMLGVGESLENIKYVNTNYMHLTPNMGSTESLFGKVRYCVSCVDKGV